MGDRADLPPPGVSEDHVKTKAAVRYDATDVPDGIFTMEYVHDAASARAMLRLVQELRLQSRRALTAFYIHISPESIQHMQLVDVAQHAEISSAYELRTVLHLPPDLIGPSWTPWTGRYPKVDRQIRQLESLAGMLRFTLFIPTRSITLDAMTTFCHAVSTPGGLQADSRLLHLQTLYGGKGGRKYEVPAPTYYDNTSISTSRPLAPPIVTSAASGGGLPPPFFADAEADSHDGDIAAPAASQPKRPRSDTSNSPGGGPHKLPRMSLSPPPLKVINDRLDALQSHLMSVFEEPLRVSAHRTQHMKIKLSQIHTELEEYLADQDSTMEEMKEWEDTILELKETVDKMSESLQEAETRLNDLEGTTMLEAAIESSEILQEWVKDYVDESVGQLLDDAVANAFRVHFADVTAAVSLFQGAVQQVTRSDKVRTGIMSKADNDTLSPSKRGSGQHTTTPTIPRALGSDDSTESDSSTSSPARPAADDVSDKEERPADTAVPEKKFTTAGEQTAAALETMASASVRIASAMERTARACEASYVPAKRRASTSSDESSITFRRDRK
jgi:uncharacterized coiled-coil protein SlyX